MRLAYFGYPHLGGTHSVFVALRKGLATHGIDVRWVGVGPPAASALVDPRWLEFRQSGEAVAGDTVCERRQAAELVDHISTSRYDGVFVNVLANRVQMNAIRYLPSSLKRLMVVHNITVGTYSAAASLLGHVHAAIGVSPRIRNDLIERIGFAPRISHAIPNCVDTERFAFIPRNPAPDAPLRLLFVGRIEDSSKGVLALPRLMSLLPPHIASLTIAGDGPDLKRLQNAFASLGDTVRLIGSVDHARVPELVANHDVFLFPSRFEGLGISLVEAMAGGCVPVASRIRGVTDFVIDDERTGLLFPIADMRTAAAHVRHLAENRSTLACMSARAREAASARFRLPEMAERYARVVAAIVEDPQPIEPPLPLENWKFPRGMRLGLRTYLPNGIKNLLRTVRER